MPILAEADTGSPVAGTDSAVAAFRPTVEIVMDGSMRAESRPVVGQETTSSKLSAAMARREPAAAAADPSPAPVVDASPDGSPPEPDEVQPDPPPTDDPLPEQPTDADKPADKPPHPTPAPAPEIAAELEQVKAELALMRGRSNHADRSAQAEERQRYLDDPVAAVQSYIGRLFGREPTDKLVEDEARHLQSELTYRAIGADTLPDDRKWQRHQEHTGRLERLKQIAPNTSPADEHAARTVAFVSSALKGKEDAFPHLALAAELGVDFGSKALALWLAEVKAGRLRSDVPDAEGATEALRLANDFYQARARHYDKPPPADTAPIPAPAPAQASREAVAPGAPNPQPSRAPAKTGSAPPTTISAKQAAAAPRVRVEPAQDDGRIVIDPSDRESEHARRIAIALRHRK